MNKLCKKMGAVILSVALAGSLLPASRMQVSAASATVKKLTVTAATKTLYVGGPAKKKTTKLKVSVKPSGASKNVTFQSSNKNVVKVTAKGKVTAVKAGKAVITITSKSNKELKKKIGFTVKNHSLGFANKTVTIHLTGTSDTTEQKLKLYGAKGKVAYSSSNEDVAVVDSNGKVTAKRMGKSVVTAVSNGKAVTCKVIVQKLSQAIHDPSVYRDPVSGKYYSFGSHLMTATSSNLIGWSDAAGSGVNYSVISTLFTKEYTEEFAEPYAFTMPKGANQNAWAPDVIYNPTMKKYCMYISIVDGSTKCCIAMASSKNPDGPYAYQGMIVCSGMETDGSDIEKTNVADALGISAGEAKASKYASLGANSPDCIDATVFYDHEGKLWMVYGSFTTAGGIRLLKLNPDTGMRGENYADSGDGTDKTLSTDDPYYGKKIANSNGEGPYIQMLADKNSSTGYYYYLWTSVGNLQYYGGYNMRVVRAENPEGPYCDTKGNEAVKDLQKYALGLRVMDNYKFSFMDSAYVSQGGNSAVEDGNGKTFIQFHTRTSDSDSFTFRTHQTFVNEDGWLVTAPFEYNGETIAGSYGVEDVAGDYEFIYHRDYFAKTTISNMDYIESERLVLNADGTVSGAYAGTWKLDGHNVTIQINDKTYKGVFLEQYEQTEDRDKVFVFTAVGSDNRAIWGSKMHKTDEDAVKYDAAKLSVKDKVSKDFVLDLEGLFGSKISWTSDNPAISFDGSIAKVNCGSAEKKVTLTAAVSKGSSNISKKFEVQVEKQKLTIAPVVQGDKLELPASFDNNAINWSSSDASVITNDGTVEQPESGYRLVVMTAEFGGMKKEFSVLVLPKSFGEAIYEEDYSSMVSDAAIATTWTSVDKQNCLYVEADESHDSFIKFAGGNTGTSQGAKTFFGISDRINGSYAVTFDVALQSGTREATEFALTGTDVQYKEGNTNAGLGSGYILKLSADANSSEWSINDSADVFMLPHSWVNVTAIADPDSSKAAIIIQDEDNIYFSGEVAVNGKGIPEGLYLRWGCTQSLVSVDNVKVFCAN
jgi:arabinan endo-1,5-alpha-L-arabinosidase